MAREMTKGIPMSPDVTNASQEASKRLNWGPCARCGTEFTPYRSWQKFCSARCKTLSWHEGHKGSLEADEVNITRTADGKLRVTACKGDEREK